MGRPKKTEERAIVEDLDEPEDTTPELAPEDTRLLNVLQYLLSRKGYTGKCNVSISSKNKGMMLQETAYAFPQFSCVREAIRDFAVTHGIEGY